MYRYFVSYQVFRDTVLIGAGNREVGSDRLISVMGDVTEIQNGLKESLGFAGRDNISVLITNFIRFEDVTA